ncbi:MAG: sigma-70 family RNA polymerase sigma factor [Salinivirgaceae bacterium]|jgi:RNA polymerase sigma factor (sigma-70 family)|nr:sigma-70 family RNA polymerase sigma factor [Salinivirgaceae bacterium]
MEIHNLSDYDLIKQYLGGNQSSFEFLINRHKSKVFSYILMVVKNRELAEDIFQDTFIKVIKSLHSGKYNEEGRFVSWVMRIAHNLVIDFYRKDKHLKTVSDDDTEVPLFNSAKYSDLNIEQELVVEQVHEDVKILVEKLPEEQKEVVKLRYYYDLSFKEIAEHTNVSINTALGRMRYAIINMRKLMEESKVDLVLNL